MYDKDDLLKMLDIYRQHVRDYETFFRKKNKLPKNYDWRPYRWCSRDIVFSLLVVRHNRQGNCLEADVCLITNPPQYIENSGARVALGFLLSEAYKCGGSMEIVFTKNVEGGRVPAYICDLAIEMRIKLNHVFEGKITPFEARQLYLELAGFSPKAKEKVMQLSVKGEFSPERICFVVMGGVWSLAEAESIILSSVHPEKILISETEPEDRQLYLNDLLIARMAIFSGALDRKLLRTELQYEGQIIEDEDIEAPLTIDFDPEYFARIYEMETDFEIPWLRNKQSLKVGEKLVVMIRARTEAELARVFDKDLANLKQLAAKYKDTGIRLAYLATRDFEDLSVESRQRIENQLAHEGILLMISPESVASLNKEAIRRLETGKVIRQ